MIRRTGIFYLALMMALTGLIFRIFWLSIGSNAAESKAVISNRINEVVLYRTKGIIYDTDLNPIAGDQHCWYLVVNPREFKSEDLNTLAKLTKEEPNVVQKKLKKETPFVLKTQTAPVKMQGVSVFEGTSRYSGVATHLLGYLDSDDDVGLAGVEKEYNDYLKLFSSKVSVTYSADAVRGAIAGLGMKTKEKEPSDNGLVLTLDQELCLQLDKSMDRHIKTGAAIIMDCKTGAVKAVSSRPNYDVNNISDYMESLNGELINRAFSAQTVGSVFKIVVAACALEGGMEDFVYQCSGGILINERTFACHNHSGHGEIGMEEAFGQSCNAYFIALGQLLGYDKIAEMAARFGYGEGIEVLGSMAAACGNFPVKSSNMSLANLSIGQGELTASPLQVAIMTAVIANGGVLPNTHLYKGLYLNGKLKLDETDSGGARIISEEHAEKLRQYCVYTVEEGTGKYAKPIHGSAGGKTASAQTGIIENGIEKLNVYFTGFYPAENPQYVITVFAENGVSGGKTCGPVFGEICDFIAQNSK